MELLNELVLTAGIPGREHRIRKLILERTKGLFDTVRVDAMGSVIGIRRPHPKSGKKVAKPKRIMIAAHMDQIGFMVRHVSSDGWVRISPVGGFDPRNLFARLITICPDLDNPRKDLTGVLNPGTKPIHIATDADKNRIPEIGEFYVDLGMDGKVVAKRVNIGDMAVLKAPITQIGNTVVSQCMDNRIACWILIRALEALKHHDCEVVGVFTVQEEVGLRGALTAAYGIKPEIGIALDTTLAVDTPGTPEDQRVSKLGGGVGITHMDSSAIGDLPLLMEFEAVAQKGKIPFQRSILTRGGTDAGAIQRSAEGVRTVTLSCPTRYIHTVTEMCHKTDMKACVDVLAAYLAQA